MNAMLAAPMARRLTASKASVGARDATRMSAPNASPAAASSRSSARPRVATTKPPTTAPRPMKAKSTP